MPMSDNALAAAVRRAREALHLNQAELAARAGVSMQTVSRIERGMPVAEETVRAVAAALGIDAVMLPPRPLREAMPGEGTTDSQWRDLLSTLTEAGERVVASERADGERYAGMAATAKPDIRTFLPGGTHPVWWFFLGVALAIATMFLSFLAYVATTGHTVPPDGAYAETVFSASAVLGCALFASGAATWRRHAPARTHDDAVEAMSALLSGERHVVTDRAAYVATKVEGPAYSWKRLALPGSFVRRIPIDGIAPDVQAVVLEDAAGVTLTLRSPRTGGAVMRALAGEGVQAA